MKMYGSRAVGGYAHRGLMGNDHAFLLKRSLL